MASELCLQVERKTWDVEKQKYKLENQQLMERLEATNRLVVKVPHWHTRVTFTMRNRCHVCCYLEIVAGDRVTEL